ncbi:ribonuclease Z [Paenibacillus alkaliterrae]|uniref:ribonuclease Z n=1 Tax=Paenibacillus alkaliterrae TaxID=320909 RepID=UPI001F344807|nr:ribonuclease Z [Paenibacillus alkaliterrae]MCF2938296.1 ribonuclease Z [Paenibacillus alkaliterrae]
MNIWFLGTGAGRPSKHRNVTAIALQLPEPSCGWWLFDAGEATQHQLMRTPLKLSKLEAVFVTHLHGDHIYGLPGLLSSRSFDGGISPVQLFGPPGLKRYMETVFEISGTQLDYELQIHEITDDEGFITDNGQVKVEAGQLDHRVPCFGYRITEHDQPGKLLVDKLKELGVEAGPLYGKLKQGESIALPNGTVVRTADVTGPIQAGRVVTVLGDTKPCGNAVKLAKDADLLVHEATFAAGLEEKAHEFGHCTTIDAAETAAKANAKRLVMTHFSGRYGNEDLIRLEEEAAERFTAVTAATDFMMIEIKREQR